MPLHPFVKIARNYRQIGGMFFGVMMGRFWSGLGADEGPRLYFKQQLHWKIIILRPLGY